MISKEFFNNIKDRLEALENSNGESGGGEKPPMKRVVKPAPREIVLQYSIEHPQATTEDITKEFNYRMTMKYYYPHRFIYPDGDVWNIDYFEERKPESLTGHELQLRELERKWRQKVGTLTKLEINDNNKKFYAEYDKECPEEEDGTTEHLTIEQWNQILAEA